MSLAQAWRRQLVGASSAALIVPFAMLAALVALALGGGFSQVGVLGQIFAGPPAIGASGGGSGGAVSAGSPQALPVISGATVAVSRPRRAQRVVRAGGPPSSGVSRGTGGAGAAPTVSGAPIRSAPGPSPGAPSRPAPTGPAPGPASAAPQPQPSPPPRPTPVDQVVTVVTQVIRQVPAPVGPAATQVVQAAGSAADGVLPPAPAGTLP